MNLLEYLKDRLNNWRNSLRLRLKRWSNSRPHFGVDDWIALFILIFGVIGYLGYPIPDWYTDLRSELIGIGASVLIIANAGEYISTLQEKKRLILQMGSPNNAFAIEAARQLASKGWFFDGSLGGANLIEADLGGADLRGANLHGADLRNADLRGANLRGADLRGAYLRGADLRGADLRGADLRGADLIGANLRGANLEDAKYTKEITWPKGFDPEAAGAKLID